MIRALVFDFDGLILDTETPIYLAWQEIFRAHGVEIPLAEWRTGIGTTEMIFDPMATLERLVGQPLDCAAIHAQRRAREHALAEVEPVMPGVMDYLDEAERRGLRLGVASSSSDRWVRGHLTRLGLVERFECLCTPNEHLRAKPEPDLYRAAVEHLEVAPHEAVAFEDSLHGVVAAKHAGLRAVAIPAALLNHLSFQEADLRLNSLADMPLEDLLQYLSGLCA
jgi:HAD superfamily hydrolase (TIGR01509 family)